MWTLWIIYLPTCHVKAWPPRPPRRPLSRPDCPQLYLLRTYVLQSFCKSTRESATYRRPRRLSTFCNFLRLLRRSTLIIARSWKISRRFWVSFKYFIFAFAYLLVRFYDSENCYYCYLSTYPTFSVQNHWGLDLFYFTSLSLALNPPPPPFVPSSWII